MRYKAKRALAYKSRIIMPGELVPLDYGRLDQAIKKGWVEPEDSQAPPKAPTGKGVEPRRLAPPPARPKPAAKALEAPVKAPVFSETEVFTQPPPIIEAEHPGATPPSLAPEVPLESAAVEPESAESPAKAEVPWNLDTPVINLPFIGVALAEKLRKELGVRKVSDLEGLTLDALLELKGVGTTIAEKLIGAYEAVRDDQE